HRGSVSSAVGLGWGHLGPPRTSSGRRPRRSRCGFGPVVQEPQALEVAEVGTDRFANQLDQLEVFTCRGREPARMLAIADAHRDQDPTTFDVHARTDYAVATRESQSE